MRVNKGNRYRAPSRSATSYSSNTELKLFAFTLDRKQKERKNKKRGGGGTLDLACKVPDMQDQDA